MAKVDFTPVVRKYFERQAKRTEEWTNHADMLQQRLLQRLLRRAANTDIGHRYGFAELAKLNSPYQAYKRRVELRQYEDIRDEVMRMIAGERDVLWPGLCHNFAQSSGTSGGKSKYIPVTEDSLRLNHYSGASDCVAHYIASNPESKLLSGKAFVLGGSFANELNLDGMNVSVGDLSANLIGRMNPAANLFRVPSKKIALMEDWGRKLPALVKASMNENITNISGVPSWFLGVIKEVMKQKGASTIHEVWPNLEVFFHGGISFEPYREIYRQITDPRKMHFMETYNASEGFFGIQNDLEDSSMLLLVDSGVFYEFRKSEGEIVPISDLQKGGVYELIITATNGLWRYRIGDTIRVENINPVKISIAGRTKSFINAFGEELMEDNAERAMAQACRRTASVMRNYTAAPVFAGRKTKGYHQWLIEWETAPKDLKEFAKILDEELRKLNSDYDAKRQGNIFLELPEVVSARQGVFEKWLKSAGTHKLGGQRKVPRLNNERHLIEAVMSMQ